MNFIDTINNIDEVAAENIGDHLDGWHEDEVIEGCEMCRNAQPEAVEETAMTLAFRKAGL